MRSFTATNTDVVDGDTLAGIWPIPARGRW